MNIDKINSRIGLHYENSRWESKIQILKEIKGGITFNENIINP